MELFVENDWSRAGITFHLKDKRGHMDCFYGLKDGILTEQIINDFVVTEDIAPFLKLPRQFSNEFIKLIADYAQQNGIKTEKQTYLEGELIATKKHLEDMQKAFNALLNKTT